LNLSRHHQRQILSIARRPFAEIYDNDKLRVSYTVSVCGSGN